MDIVVAMGLFFIIVTVVFIAVAIFIPELVGITGKRAKEIQMHQQEDAPPQDPHPQDVSAPPSHGATKAQDSHE